MGLSGEPLDPSIKSDCPQPVEKCLEEILKKSAFFELELKNQVFKMCPDDPGALVLAVVSAVK